MISELLVALVVVAILVMLSKKKDPRLPPSYSGGIPFFGCFIKFGQNPVGCVRWAYEKFGDCFTLKLLGHDMTYMVGPEAQAVFFRATDEELSAKEAYQFMVPVFGKGVVYDSPTEVMYEQLRFVRSSLALNQLKKSVSVIETEAIAYFREHWGDSGEVDLLTHMNNLTILTASRCLMGESIREHLGKNNTHIAHLYHELEQGINPLSFFFPYLPLPGFKRRDAARAEVAELFRKIIAERRKSNNSEDCEDIMGILMNSEYKDGTKLEDEHLAGMMIALLFAGQHTSSITATWTALLLHSHKEFLDEVIAEQRAIRAQNKGAGLSFDNIKSMNKLENSIRETLRMYPPLIMLMRKVLTEITYTSPVTKKEFVIPAGHVMCVSPGAAMTMETGTPFTNPTQYDPHRWESPRAEHLKHPFAIISFGGGRHGCPGENFGIIQIKTLWSVIMNTYEVELPAVPPADYTSLVAGPKPPVMIKYKKRTTPLV